MFLFRIRVFSRALAGILLLLLLTLAACGTTFQTTTGSNGPVQVVAAENFWGSIAAQVGGSHVHVTSIIVDPNADPHSYEPTAADARTVAQAQYVIVNGAGYDPWSDKLLQANPASGRKELNVGDFNGKHAGPCLAHRLDHVEVVAHYYSVSYRFARAEVDARLTAQTVEIFLKGERIAAHMRMSGNHKHATVAEHMPSSHRRYAGWTIDRIRADARLIGPATAALCELILEQRPHPEQGFRACLGIVRLAGPHGAKRLEAAAERAIDIGARTYGSVKSILDNHLDRRPAQKRATDGTSILHSNIRGPRYYN